MDAVPDELLGRCFVASGDADQPALLARVACVSPRLRRVVNSFCWRLAVQQRWPALAVAAASEGGVADADDAGWRALYKLCAYCPRPRALLPNDNQVVRCLRARVALARNVRPVEALLEVPKKGRRKAQTVSVFSGTAQAVYSPEALEELIDEEADETYGAFGDEMRVAFVWRGYAPALAGRLSSALSEQPAAGVCVFCGAAAHQVDGWLSKEATLAECARAEHAFSRMMRRHPNRFGTLELQTSAEVLQGPCFGGAWASVDPQWMANVAWRLPMRVCERGHALAAWSCKLRTEEGKEIGDSYAYWKHMYNGGYCAGEMV